MKNIFRIFYRDFKRVSTNVVAVVIVIGLSIIPSLYAWYIVQLGPVWTGIYIKS